MEQVILDIDFNHNGFEQHRRNALFAPGSEIKYSLLSYLTRLVSEALSGFQEHQKRVLLIEYFVDVADECQQVRIATH